MKSIKTLSQLLGMLRTAESNIKGWIQIHSIESAKQRERKVIKSKVNGKTKAKGKSALKPKGGVSCWERQVKAAEI